MILHWLGTNLGRGKRFPQLPFVVCWQLVCLWGMGNFARAEEEVDYYTVLEALDAYEKTLNPLCLSGRYKENYETSVNSTNNYIQENNHCRMEFDCDLANGRWRYDQRHSWIFSKYSKEPFEVRKIESFDGQQSYELLYTYGKEPTRAGLPPESPYKLYIRSPEGNIPGNLHPLRLAGLGFKHVGQEGQSLLSLLQTEPCTWEGRDQFSRVSCYKITIRPRSRSSQIAVWFDPAHDFLPLRQERRQIDDSGEPKPHISSLIETTQFQEFPIPGGKKVWLPARARMQSLPGMEVTFDLLEARFQKTLPVERFRIDTETLPPGVFVSDGLEHTSYYTGGDEGQALHEEWLRLFDVVEDNLRQKLGDHPHSRSSAVPVTAQRKENTGEDDFTWLITNVCLLVLLASGWICYRLCKSRIRKHE